MVDVPYTSTPSHSMVPPSSVPAFSSSAARRPASLSSLSIVTPHASDAMADTPEDRSLHTQDDEKRLKNVSFVAR